MEEYEIDQAALLSTFGVEARDLLDDMERRLLELERSPGDDDALHALFRAAHTVKGGALMVRLDAVRGLAHATEDLLERWRDGRLPGAAGLVGLLLSVVDGLRRGIADGVAGLPTDENRLAALRERLRATLEGRAPAAGDLPTFLTSDAVVPGDGPRPLRVEVGKLDRMLDLTGEIAIARGRLTDMLEREGAFSPDQILEAHRESDRLFLDLQELVMKARMVPLGPVFHQHQRTVRDLSASLGKQLRLVAEGGDVEVDTAVVEGVRDPLGHMIRNAVDHGLETAEERRAAGKDPIGTITLRAVHDGSGILVEVADDGRGLDLRAIAEKAACIGLVPDASRVTDAEASQLLFEPGVSTSAEVTDISGRGVGMDVVRRNVEALRGSVELHSEPGRGTRVSLRLPLTLAIIQGFRVEVAGDVYVIPLDAVAECLDLKATGQGALDDAEGVMELRGLPLPYLRLRRLLALEGQAPGREAVVVVGQGLAKAGLAVDRLLGESQVVIKPLGRAFRGLAGISGSAILGDGRVALILDVPALLRKAVRRQAAEPVL